MLEEKKQCFQHVMLYYFKKGKNTTETQKKICAVYGEGAVTDRTCQKWFAKFHAGDFSNWMMLHGRVDQLKLIMIKSRHKLRTVNVIPCGRQLTYSKYPNQALKIICTSLVMLIALMFGFHLSYVKKTFLTIFLRAILY